jgi:hypothetical protein
LDEDAFASWLEVLERRHLDDLRFSEVTRALRALSADYVERRGRVRGASLEGRGKRAAFALYYGPLHFLVVRAIAGALGAANQGLGQIVDLGCGTGAAGAALAIATDTRSIIGVDRHGWALTEAASTYRHFRLRHHTIRGDAAGALSARGGITNRLRGRAAFLAAYTVNELTDPARAVLLPELIDRAAAGSAVLIVEPISRRVAPWWNEWATAFEREQGRADEWRFTMSLPERVRAFDRAAGLDHREQTARSLWMPTRHV